MLRACCQSLALWKRCLLAVLLMAGAGAVLVADYEWGQQSYDEVLIWGAVYSIFTLPLVWAVTRRTRLIGAYFLAFVTLLSLVIVVPGDAQAQFVADSHRLHKGMTEAEARRVMIRYSCMMLDEDGTSLRLEYWGGSRWRSVMRDDDYTVVSLDHGKVDSVEYTSGDDTGRCGCD